MRGEGRSMRPKRDIDKGVNIRRCGCSFFRQISWGQSVQARHRQTQPVAPCMWMHNDSSRNL